MKLAGLEIDLVNLRSESYADSRIPTMQIGTPREDAMRCVVLCKRLHDSFRSYNRYRGALLVQVLGRSWHVLWRLWTCVCTGSPR